MNNKEFVTEMGKRTGYSATDVASLMTALMAEMETHLEEEAMVSIIGFGNFEIKKKLERVVVNPSTKQRMLVPPKLVLSFKPSTTLKEKL